MNEFTVIGNYDKCKRCGCIISKGSRYELCEAHEKERDEMLEELARLKRILLPHYNGCAGYWDITPFRLPKKDISFEKFLKSYEGTKGLYRKGQPHPTIGDNTP